MRNSTKILATPLDTAKLSWFSGSYRRILLDSRSDKSLRILQSSHGTIACRAVTNLFSVANHHHVTLRAGECLQKTFSFEDR